MHPFFTTLMWYICALNFISLNSCGPEIVEDETISLLKMSNVTIVDTQLALVLILSIIDSKDMKSIKV